MTCRCRERNVSVFKTVRQRVPCYWTSEDEPWTPVRGKVGTEVVRSSSTSGFVDDVMFLYHTEPMARIMHDAMFRKSSPDDGTGWTFDNYSVWSSASECGTEGEVCYLRLT